MILLGHLGVRNFKSLTSVTLCFPPQGAVLIEGLNESGKSTLFESIHFALYGRGLATRSGGGSVEDLISYGKAGMSVVLSLRAGDRRLTVERHARRGRPSRASLRIAPSDGPCEEVTGVRAVNQRIVEELNGLNSEALLNSCFVEQKQLSRLEDQQSADRLASLLRLLNLDRLVQIEAALREEERALPSGEVARRTAELAAEYQRFRAESALVREEEAQVVEGLQVDRAELLARVAGLSRLLQHAAEPPADRQAPAAGRPRPAAIRSAAAAAATALAVGALLALLLGHPAAALLLFASAAAAGGLGAAFGRSAPAATGAGSVRPSGEQEARAWRTGLGLSEHDNEAEAYGQAQRELGGIEARLAELSAARQGPFDGGQAVPVPLRERYGRIRQEAAALGLRLSDLDAEATAGSHAALLRRARVLQHERALLSRVRDRILGAVLPDTERNMQLILPRLTAGRYHDARVDDQYRIQAWDEAAGEYVPKQVFSGGTKDQLSLALRLAFALASLPQELGASPGFLFLDEPLSSFDEERAEALIHLITKGELAAAFPQIYIISHSRAFDRSAFTYTIEMDRGAVRRSTLPACSSEAVA